ncbi:hypothetical protein RIR_jg8438.t1 [Rhizophagus irregularis DAOM 181602=DAOM 197198]|nr:hypothetical protein RIR_jg8438.t1 [Rhizophagus irregularis DAOM 181602=DAOM 197198]
MKMEVPSSLLQIPCGTPYWEGPALTRKKKAIRPNSMQISSSRGKTLEDTYQWRDYAPQAKIELKPLVKTLNFINEKTPSIPSGMVANRYLGLRGDLNIAMWITFIQSPS